MKQKRKFPIIAIYSVFFIMIAGANIKWNIVLIPRSDEMQQIQIDYITINTVFAGFSFTALGLLLGMSSEKLILAIKSTGIMLRKVNRIIISIIFFIISVMISLVFILGLERSLIGDFECILIIQQFLYVVGVEYMVGGIGYFVYSVYELWDLIKRVYIYNKPDSTIMNTVMTQINKEKYRIDEAKKEEKKDIFE